jgi:hypothetical protein
LTYRSAAAKEHEAPFLQNAEISLTAGGNGRGGGRAGLKSMTFSPTWQSMGTFMRDGKTVPALPHCETKLRDTPPAGRPQIFDRCKSNDDRSRMSGISLLPARSVE